MSFGRPPSFNAGFQASPPDRGAFPLDHDGLCTVNYFTRPDYPMPSRGMQRPDDGVHELS
jgi:hypothetical protein